MKVEYGTPLWLFVVALLVACCLGPVGIFVWLVWGIYDLASSCGERGW